MDLPGPETVIGIVTTGGYSTTRGRGYAIGVCAVRSLWELDAFGRHGLAPARARVAIRNAAELICRPARLQILP